MLSRRQRRVVTEPAPHMDDTPAPHMEAPPTGRAVMGQAADHGRRGGIREFGSHGPRIGRRGQGPPGRGTRGKVDDILAGTAPPSPPARPALWPGRGQV